MMSGRGKSFGASRRVGGWTGQQDTQSLTPGVCRQYVSRFEKALRRLCQKRTRGIFADPFGFRLWPA